MDGFDDAVNGYFDVEDQLSRYLLQRADDLASTGRDRTASIDARSDVEAHRERVRSTLLERIGGLPDPPEDLSVETAARHQRDGYSIELLTFESRPNVHVTANCYVPGGDGPHPGLLFLCGHADPPKADRMNQRACIQLALHGFVVLIVDPLGQGERKQYRDLTVEGSTVSGGGGTFPHIYAGQKCFYTGTNLARYMIHDERCALEYLHGRDNVDDGRIGVTGASGGGTRAMYLSLVDDRIDAAAPCCAVSRRYEQMKTGGRTHAEEAITGSVADGVDYDDLLAALAPRPVCIGAAASDRYFPIEGVRETLDRVRRFYGRFDAEERVTLVVGDNTHCSVYGLGDGVLEWLCDVLGDVEYDPHDGVQTLDESELRCTSPGNVLDAYADERTIDDLIREDVTATYPDAGTRPTVDHGEYAEQLRRTLVETFDLDREDCGLAPRLIYRTDADGLHVERVWFKTERDPDVVVTGVLASDPESTAERPAVVLYERGTDELPERSEEVASLASEYGTVFVFDPRGVGAVRNREILVPTWADDYYGVFGTEFKLANDALVLGTSLFGMRVYDVLRADSFLRSKTGTDHVSFVGDGIGAYHALYAAAAARNVDRVDLRALGPTFFERATERGAPFDPRLTVFDVIGECDVPHLLAALDGRGVRVVDGRNAGD